MPRLGRSRPALNYRPFIAPVVPPSFTPVSDTDSGAGAEVSTVVVLGTETGAGAETATLALTAPETGSGTDTATISLSSADTGAGLDAGESINATLADTETGAGAESAKISLTSADTGSGTDTGSVSVQALDSDAGSGAEAGAVKLLASDTGAGLDAGESIHATLSDADTGAGAEAVARLLVQPASQESGAGAEAGTVAVSSADTGSGAEAATVKLSAADAGSSTEGDPARVSLSSLDSGSVTSETGAVPTSPTDADSGHLQDSEIFTLAPSTETAAATEAAVIYVSDTEAVAGADAQSVFQSVRVVQDADAGAGGEVSSRWLSDADSAAALEAGTGAGPRSDADAFTGADAGTVAASVVDADTGSGAEALKGLGVWTTWPTALHQFGGVLHVRLPSGHVIATGTLSGRLLELAQAVSGAQTVRVVGDSDTISAGEQHPVAAKAEAALWLGDQGRQIIVRARAWDGSQWVAPELELQSPQGVCPLEVSSPHPERGYVTAAVAAVPGQWVLRAGIPGVGGDVYDEVLVRESVPIV